MERTRRRADEGTGEAARGSVRHFIDRVRVNQTPNNVPAKWNKRRPVRIATESINQNTVRELDRQ